MKILALAITAASLAAAVDMPEGFFRGAMVDWSGSLTLGTLRARAKDGSVFSCGFDAKSYMEFEKKRVSVEKLLEGDPLEAIVYRRPKDDACYILTLSVVPPPKPVRPTRRIDMSPPRPAKPVVARHGTENVAGVVVQIGASSLTLRTREGEQTFLLRRDTRYFGDGLKMERTDVAVNQRLSVEAGRNVDGTWEAFQLTWGSLSVH